MGLNSPAGLEGLQLRATTFNCTAAGQARELLQSSQAHVIMMQEIKMDYMAICDFTAWCSARGWQLLASESVPGPAGSEHHLSAGVAIVAKAGFGLRRPAAGATRSHVVEPSRLVVGVLDIPGGRSILVGLITSMLGKRCPIGTAGS